MGLAIGMACTLLICIYLSNEFSFDNFHSDADQIYRITVEGNLSGKKLNTALTSAPMAETMIKEFPQVKMATRVARFGVFLLSTDSLRYSEENLILADRNFFRLFSFRLIKGNIDSVLVKPRSIVLTRSTAKKYFGNQDPVGKKLRVENEKSYYTVTGLMEDVPFNSHFHFDMVASLATFNNLLNNLWISHNFYTYIKVAKGTDAKKLESDIQSLITKYVTPQVNDYFGFSLNGFAQGSHSLRYHLQKLRKIHLYSHSEFEHEDNGNALYAYTFGVVALLILLIACLNFINLSTAGSANRAREVVLRKVIGSERKMIIMQFLTESILLSYISLIFALFLAEHFIPYFNQYLDLDLHFDLIRKPLSVFVVIVFTFIIGTLAGAYPAFFISSYQPAKILHGILFQGTRNRTIRSVFVIFQFFITILIIIMSFLVFAQVSFMLNKNLGFEKERILVIRRSDALKGNLESFRKETLSNPNIVSVSNSTSIPGRNFWSSTYVYQGDTGRTNILLNQIFVNYDFCEAYGLKIAEGRFFSDTVASDSNACVINETAKNLLNSQNIIGKKLFIPGFYGRVGMAFNIIGVVKDFNFASVDKAIEPLIISLMAGNWEGYLNIKLSSNDIEKSIDFIGQIWGKYSNNYPFVYFFLDKDFDTNYRSVIRTGRVLLIFSIISIIIACLGLLGLIWYTTVQRTHEIGIRKALGATNYRIIFMLIKETVILIIVATLLAWAAAYLFSTFWLSEFNTRISLSPKYFIFASVIVLILSVVVVFYQTYVAANLDPAEAIKSD